MVLFTFKLLSKCKNFWTVHYGAYVAFTDEVFECDKNGRIPDPDVAPFKSAWEFVKERHWNKKGQSVMVSIFFYGHSAAAYISRGMLSSRARPTPSLSLTSRAAQDTSIPVLVSPSSSSRTPSSTPPRACPPIRSAGSLKLRPSPWRPRRLGA